MRRTIAFLAVFAALAGLSPSASFAEPPPAAPGGGAVRELRLGVICYGGVSLAVYMFGTTRELHHLALASRALDCAAEGSPAACGEVRPEEARGHLPSDARVYYDVLEERWRAEGVRTRVVIDIISGTSAGGLNGILLAKALAHDLPLDSLRRLWFEEAAIGRLAGRPFPVARSVWRLVRTRQSLLQGDSWLRNLYEALERMDEDGSKAARPSFGNLLSASRDLDLLVTATDFYGSDHLVEVGDPLVIREARHDHVFRFSPGDLSRDSNPALAFAGRASASFPVAFPAIRLSDLPVALGREALDVETLVPRLFPQQLAELAGVDGARGILARNLFLVDGGVLDNRPISIAFQRVSRRSPRGDSRRVFLYLEPDPGATTGAIAEHRPPTALQTAIGGKSSIPGAEPIAGDLAEIGDHNRRVERIREIVRKDERAGLADVALLGVPLADDGSLSIAWRVEQTLEQVPGFRELGLADPKQRRLLESPSGGPDRCRPGDPGTAGLCGIGRVRRAIERDAASQSPLIEQAYSNLRVQSVLDQLSRILIGTVCDLPDGHPGPRATVLREVVAQWAGRRALTGASADPRAVEAFLEAYDLGYLRRNLRFVDDWITSQYGHLGQPAAQGAERASAWPAYGLDRAQLDTARRALAERSDEVSRALGGDLGDDPEVRRALGALRSGLCVPLDAEKAPRQSAEAILDANVEAIDRADVLLRAHLVRFQDGVRAKVFEEFDRQSRGWKDPDAGRAVLARYLGFPYWDRVAYPYTAFSGSGDLTRIDVVRFSPAEATSVSRRGAGKLSGSRFAHFGAFFSADGRQRDYLWGRLDGAERLLALLSAPASARAEIHRAILTEEGAAGDVAAQNLRFLEVCVARPGTC